MGLAEFVILLIVLIMPLAALTSMSRDSLITKEKPFWTVVIIFLPFFGPIAYLISTWYTVLTRRILE